MRILVVGGGGREHALLLGAARGRPHDDPLRGTGQPRHRRTRHQPRRRGHRPRWSRGAAREHRIDLVVVGPEAPLAAGLVDRLRDRRTPRIRTHRRRRAPRVVQGLRQGRDGRRRRPDRREPAPSPTIAPALAYIDRHAEPLVVKASGLAAGKGAVVCATRAEARRRRPRHARATARWGRPASEIVVEEFLDGEELSVLALTDGEHIVILPGAQDHKRLGEGDTGPNTGGMGAYCPVSVATPALLDRVRRDVFAADPRRADAPRLPLPRRAVRRPDDRRRRHAVGPRVQLPLRRSRDAGAPPGAAARLHGPSRGDRRRCLAAGVSVLPARGAAVTTVLAARGYPDRPERGAAISLPREPGDRRAACSTPAPRATPTGRCASRGAGCSP